MSADAPLIHARGLIKQFGNVPAVGGTDFDVLLACSTTRSR
jgi:hypothetical protein